MERRIPRKYEEVTMISEELIESIKLGEGFSSTVYNCTSNRATIGYGRCVDGAVGGGISEEEAEMLLMNDIRYFAEAAERVVGRVAWSWINQRQRDALTEMCFNMGEGNLKKFKNMIAAIEALDMDQAAEEALDSRWAQQVGQRANRLAEKLRG
jgi:lysozyme